jgi:peptidoglycan/xylan/chitin deacetylase (PgdA/CDA1 family)
MGYLHTQGYSPISLNDLVAHMNGRGTLPEKPVIITFDDGDASHYFIAYPILMKYGFTGTFFVTVGALDSPGSLSLMQLKQMHQDGVSIESHTLTHPYLTQLSKYQLQRELRESKVILEEKLNSAVNFIAIPGGIYDNKVIAMVKEAGYIGAATSDLGINDVRSDLCRLKRISIHQGTQLSRFADLLNGRGLMRRKSRQVMLTIMKKTLGITNYERSKRSLLRLVS